jgi:ribosome-associated translation inhibitor RaiA
MKIRIKHLNHQPSAAFSTHLKQQLLPIGEIRQIDEARITLEHRYEESPAFRVAVHLVTPGPDLTADAVDHTLRAALAKAIEEINTKIEDRGASRTRRARGKLQQPAALQPGGKPRPRH